LAVHTGRREDVRQSLPGVTAVSHALLAASSISHCAIAKVELGKKVAMLFGAHCHKSVSLEDTSPKRVTICEQGGIAEADVAFVRVLSAS
jgi:hypothetical protein